MLFFHFENKITREPWPDYRQVHTWKSTSERHESFMNSFAYKRVIGQPGCPQHSHDAMTMSGGKNQRIITWKKFTPEGPRMNVQLSMFINRPKKRPHEMTLLYQHCWWKAVGFRFTSSQCCFSLSQWQMAGRSLTYGGSYHCSWTTAHNWNNWKTCALIDLEAQQVDHCF